MFVMKGILASRSPRRRELLEQIGIEYEVLDIDIDESWDGHETPREYVRRIALEKARAGRVLSHSDLPVLAADTAVVLDQQILGKAETRGDAVAMLSRLSGRIHHVLSAVAVIKQQEHCQISISKVRFKDLSNDEINAYCSSDEPIGKAGGYAIQGQAAVFIERLEGSYSGVMGLPLFETYQLLKNAS